MKTGLVLEGGGMRGLYSVGVLDALMDAQILPAYIIGVSAGAANAVSYIAGQRERGLTVNTRYAGDKRYASFANFLRERSVFGMDFIFDEIPNKLVPLDFDALLRAPCTFYAAVTDVQTGAPVYFEKAQMGRSCDIIRASSSLPVFSPMVQIGGRKYLDGGVSDPIPVKRALADGCARVVVVRTRPLDYVKIPEHGRVVYRRVLRDYPHMIAALDKRHIVYNDTCATLRELTWQGRALQIAPRTPLPVRRFEKDRRRLMAAYDMGFADAQAQMGDIRRMLDIQRA